MTLEIMDKNSQETLYVTNFKLEQNFFFEFVIFLPLVYIGTFLKQETCPKIC